MKSTDIDKAILRHRIRVAGSLREALINAIQFGHEIATWPRARLVEALKSTEVYALRR